MVGARTRLGLVTSVTSGLGLFEGVRGTAGVLLNSQLCLDLLQRNALGLRDQCLHPYELENHHAGKKREHVTGRECGDHLGEESGEQGGENPVREAAEGLAFRTMAIGKYL